MRFEIGTGGTFLILVGLLGLSGAVFALGLIAGYEMARQNQPDVSSLSSVYPVPSPPAAEETPAAPPAEALAPGAATSPGGVAAAPRPALAPRAAMTPAAIARTRPPIVAPASRPSTARATEPSEEDTDEEEAPPPRAVASVPSPASAPGAAVAKPFNIQIEAVMDKSGADDMVAKLKALGYEPHQSETQVNGQTWYRVQVGPYATQDDARAAQEKLRQQYRAAYSTH